MNVYRDEEKKAVLVGVIEALLLTVASGEYRTEIINGALQALGALSAAPADETYQQKQIEERCPEHGSFVAHPDGSRTCHVVGCDWCGEHPMKRMRNDNVLLRRPEVRASMYRAAGLDPDGEAVPLPKKLERKERPFVPNKFGEHGDD